MAEEEIIPEVEQHPPQLQQKKQQQQQQQEIKADDEKKKGKTALSKEDKKLFRKFEDKYKFEWENKRAGAVVTRVGDDIIFIRKIPTNAKGYAEYKNGPYLILKTNIENFIKFKNKEIGKSEKGKAVGEAVEGMADDDKEEDNIIFEYFNFSKDYFDKNEKLFADSLKQKKFLFNDLGKEKKEVNYLGWNDFKKLNIIPNINDEKDYINKLKNFNVEKIQDNIFVKIEAEKKEKDLFGIGDEEQIQENEEEPLPKKEDIEIEDEDAAKQHQGFNEDEDAAKQPQGFNEDEDAAKQPQGFNEDEDAAKQHQGFNEDEDAAKQHQGFIEDEDDIDNSDSERMTDTDDDIPEINVQDLQHQQQQQKQQKQLVAQNNQLINAGHTPNGEELKALIKYNNNSDSLLKLIVSLSENNKGEVDFKEIGEIQDLNGDITNLYSDIQELKSKINSSNNAEEKERLLIKYNKKRLKLEDLIKKYSKEAYRLSTLKKKKATMATHKYLMNKLNKLKT